MELLEPIMYNLNTVFHFGKYKGKTLAHIFDNDPSYIEWCALTIDDFCISDEALIHFEDFYGEEQYLSLMAIQLMEDRKNGIKKDMNRHPNLRHRLPKYF